MNISPNTNRCERNSMLAGVPMVAVGLIALLLVTSFCASAQSNVVASNVVAGPVSAGSSRTSPPPAQAPLSAPVSSPGQKLDESVFKIIAERNIFNANRSGGRVTVASSRRPTRIDSFALVGTMAYQKGAFAFFDGSSSEFSKVLQVNGVIAGHKIVDVRADGVMLEADGRQFELPVGSQMRREDTDPWHLAEGGAVNGTAYAASNSGESSARSSRTESGRARRTESADSGSRPATSPTPTASIADQSEILKRLMERREKE